MMQECRLVALSVRLCLQIAFLIYFSGATCLTMRSQESAAQRDQDLQESKARVQSYVDQIRPKLFADLTAPEEKIYRTISFRVSTKDEASSAISLIEDGRPVIEIGVGYGREMEMMAEALLIENAQKRAVLVPYAQYVAREWNRKATFIKDPTAFAHYNPNDLDNEPIIAMTLSGMAFVLAHEVGHHVLHHYDRPPPTDVVQLRQLEEDADSWAITRCVTADFSPLGGVLPLMLDYYLTATPVSTEKHSDHPADVRRMKAMFEAMEQSLPQFRHEIERKGQSYEEFRRYLHEQILEYERQIDEDSPPIDELSDQRQSTTHHRREDSIRYGAFCGTVQGIRYCPMSVAAPLGTPCQCPGIPGWGVTVP
jgi:hypothetical protein